MASFDQTPAGPGRVTGSIADQLFIENDVVPEYDLDLDRNQLLTENDEQHKLDCEEFPFTEPEMEALLYNDPELQRLIQEYDSGGGEINDGIMFDDRRGIFAGEVATRDKNQKSGKEDQLFDGSAHKAAVSQSPIGNCTDLKKVARHLQKTYVALSSFDEHSIVKLLQKGAKVGIQPKLSKKNEQAQVPVKLPKRRRKKRGPYKMAKRDSWTSCSERGGSGSGSALHNILQNQRSPLTPFKEYTITVNEEVDLHRDSTGEAEVRQFVPQEMSRQKC